MKMLNLIIGKNSNLSHQLGKKLENVVLISAKDISNNITILAPYLGQKVNIIFNNFQMATKLGDVSNPANYIGYSIGTTSKVLQYIKENNIQVNKIIYTSSSSVYGNNILCKETDELKPNSLHAALKVANEKLISQYCVDNKIEYTIARIFNMYGGDDHFSVISKILHCYKNGLTFTVANHGSAIRDFINIEDVVSIYEKLLKTTNVPILNLGTGEGVSIKNIIDFLKIHEIHLKVDNVTKEEIKMSTADNSLLLNCLHVNTFMNVETYLLKQISK